MIFNHKPKQNMKQKILKYLTIAIAGLGIIASLDAIPFVPQNIGAVIIGGALILGNSFTRIGDLLDDGKLNDSFKG